MRRKTAWLIAGGLLIAVALTAATYQPDSFPFLRQFRVLEERQEKGEVTLFLAADFQSVLQTAQKQPDYEETSMWMDNHRALVRFRNYNVVSIDKDLNSSTPYNRPRYQSGQCYVYYRPEPSLLTKLWLWSKRHWDPAYR